MISAMAALAFCTAFAQPRLTKDNIDEVIAAMTDEEKALILVGGARTIVSGDIRSDYTPGVVAGAAGSTRALERFGIPYTIFADGPVGVRIDPTRPGDSNTYYATAFPIGTLIASSWDESLVTEMATAMGEEVKEYGVDVLLGPGMNIHRNPLCGRNFEYFSEDPLLSGKIAAAYVRGIQSNGVGTSVKHFAANSQETNRLLNDAIVSRRALREIYLKNFEIAVKESQPWTVMASYNQLNGDYTQQKKDLLTTVLRDEWGFEGMVMTDWGSKDNTVKAVKAGNDLMESGTPEEYERILAAVKDGTITPEELDRNVRHILEYVVKTPKFAGFEWSNRPDLAAHAQTALRTAEESIVLLRNENGALPLSGNERLAVYGVSSEDFTAGGNGAAYVHKAYMVTVSQALEAAGFTVDPRLSEFYKSYVTYYDRRLKLWNEYPFVLGEVKVPEVDVPEHVIRQQCLVNDAAVIVLGRNAGEGADRTEKDDFELSQVERDLVRNVSAAYHSEGKKVIVVLNIGGVIETASWKDLVDGIVLPWSPGQEGANALAGVLTGRVNPSGRLPMTFPVSLWDIPSTRNFPVVASAPAAPGARPVRNVDYTLYEEGIYVGYRHFSTRNVAVSYPFGYGLSYTAFSFSNPKVSPTEDGFTATVEVRNTGSVAGKEVVELYVSAPEGGLDKPARELKAFAKTLLLQPGETQTVTLSVDNYSLASFNEAASAWEAAEGTYTLLFSSDVNTPLARAEYTLDDPQSWKVNDVLAPPALD